MVTSQSGYRPALAGFLATTVLVGGGVMVFGQAKLGLKRAQLSQIDQLGTAPFAEALAMEKRIGRITGKLRENRLRVGTPVDSGEGVDFYEAWLWNKRHRLSINGDDSRLDADALDQIKRMRGWGTSGGGGPRFNAASGGTGAWPGTPGAITKWEFMGPRDAKPAPQLIYFGPAESRISGRVNDVTYDPSDASGKTIYLASAGGGVWKTVDAGTNWKQLSDDTFDQLETSAIAVNKNGVILVGLGDYPGGGRGRGVMRSTDGGATWTRVGLNLANTAISDIEVHPDLPNTVFLSSSRGVFRSTDGGVTWDPLTPPEGTYSRLAIAAADPGTGARYIYASRVADFDLPATAIFRSRDNGDSWTRLTIGLPGLNSFNSEVEVAASPNNPNTVYYVDASSFQTDGRVLRSDSAGEANTWRDVTGNFPDGAEVGDPGYNYSQFFYDIHLDVGSFPQPGPDLDMLYMGGISIAGSAGGGLAWTDIGQTYVSPEAVQTHNDQHAMAFSHADLNRSIIANDGGVYNMDFTGSNWDLTKGWAINKTLGVTQFYAADWHPTEAEYMLGGTQDNSTPRTQVDPARPANRPFKGDPFHWDNVGAGDGFGSLINPVDPNFQYTSFQNGGIIGTSDGWATRSFFSPNWNQTPPFFTILAMSAAAPQYVWARSNQLYRWDENTNTWANNVGGTNFTPDEGLGFEEITTIACSPSNPNILYVGTSGFDFTNFRLLGKLWMVRFNGGPNGYLNPANAVVRHLDIYNPGLGDVRCFPPGSGSPAGIAIGQVRISTIQVNPANPFDITVGTVDNSRNPVNNGVRLWRCRNTNNVWFAPQILPQFIPISGIQGTATALPTAAPNAIEADPDDPFNTFYVANNFGVFVSKDAGSTWYNAGSNIGLPIVSVRAMKAVRGTGFLNIATFGRGMWRLPLDVFKSPQPSPFLLTPSLKRALGNINCDLRFTNLGKRELSGISIVSSQFIPDSGALVNGTTISQITPNVLAEKAVGRGTVRFTGSTGRAGTLGTLRVTVRYTVAGGAINAQNDVRVRLP